MNINKKFNDWIAFKFRGLSAHSLCQFIGMYIDELWLVVADYVNLPSDPVCINNFVYVTLFRVFIGTASEDDLLAYNALLDCVEECAWL